MIQENVLLKDFTTLKVGGPAACFAVVAHAKAQNQSVHIIGGGSNILVPEKGLSGLTIKNAILGYTETTEDTTVVIEVGAGESFDELVGQTVAKGYWGLENLSHIPGAVGASPVQNIGAYGVEVKDVITHVEVFNIETETFEILTNESCMFEYRDSIFKHPDGKKYIVVSVTFVLQTNPNPRITYRDLSDAFTDIPAPAITDIRNAVIAIRSQKFPDWTKVGTAGSFFKNPIIERETFEKLRQTIPDLPGFDVSETRVKIPLAWVLDHVCALKGVQQGNVGTYHDQALVLINNGNATEDEIVMFAKYVEQSVFEKTGITIEWEVTRMS